MSGCCWGSMVAAVGIMIALPAIAEEKPASDAERLFREGRTAMKAQQYKTACSKFEESFDLEPAVGTLLNLSECSEKQNKLVEALKYELDAISKLPEGDERIPRAKERQADLVKRVPLLTLTLARNAPGDVTVSLDGTQLNDTQLGKSMPMNPGKHTARVTESGTEGYVRTIPLREGDRKELVLETPGPGSHPDETPGSIPDSGSSKGTWGYVLGGLGVIGLGVGTYFVFRAMKLDSDATAPQHYGKNQPGYDGGTFCDAFCSKTSTDAHTASSVALGMLIGGAALTATGVVLVIAGSPATRNENKPVSVSAAVTPGSAGLRIGGAW